MSTVDPQWARICELVADALELPQPERREFLKKADVPEDVRREALSLVEAADRADDSLSLGRKVDFQSPPLTSWDASAPTLVGRRLGAYEIVREIGRGGMGVVYLARRADDLFQRTVAVKLVQSLFVNHDFTRRFRRETRILGKLQHPAIVSLLDAGSTEQRQPYMVMEYVDGLPLHEYAEREKLALPAVLRLLITLCEALAYAHGQGVVHRDIKPSNILVDARGDLKLLDFGIARIVEASWEQPEVTATEFRAITPNYASPEQVAGGAVTAQSDLYSVGVVLYVLLTGTPPFRLTGLSAREVEQVLLRSEPAQPSKAAGTRFAAAEIAPLDAVISRAMHPQPEQRYASAEELKADLQRVLAHEVTSASSLGSRWRRRLARYRSRERAGAIATGALVLALASLLWSVHQSRRSPDRTQAPSREGRVSVAVIPLRPEGADPWTAVAAQEALSEELASGDQVRVVPPARVAAALTDLHVDTGSELDSTHVARLGKLLGVQYVVEERIKQAAGDEPTLEVSLRKPGAAQVLARQSASFSPADLGPQTQRMATDIARLLPLRHALQTSPSLLPHAADAVRAYAEGLEHLRALEPGAARDDFERALRIEPNSGIEHAALARTWDMLGYRKRAVQEADAALGLITNLPPRTELTIESQADEIQRKWPAAVAAYQKLHDYDPDDIEYVLGLSRSQAAAGQDAEALKTIEAAKGMPSLLGADPRLELLASKVEEDLGHHKEALQHADNALAAGSERGATQLMAQAQNARASALESLGEADRGMQAAQEAQRLFASSGDLRGLGTSLIESGNFLEDHARFAEAKAAHTKARQIFTDLGDEGNAATAENDLGIVAADVDDLQEALDHYRSALRGFTRVDNTQRIPLELNNIGTVEKNLGDLQAAKRDYTTALSLLLHQQDPNRVAREYTNLGTILIMEGDLDQAQRYFAQAYDTYAKSGQTRSLFYALTGLAHVAWNRGKLDEAHAKYQEALAISRKLADTQQQGLILRADAHVLHDRGEDQRAEAELNESAALRKANQQAAAAAETELSSVLFAVDRKQPVEDGRLAALVRVFDEKKEDEDSADTHLVWARSLLLRDDVADARQHLQTARGIAMRLHVPGVKQHMVEAEAALALRQHRTASAQAAIATALAQATKVHDVPEQMHLRLFQAELLEEQHRASHKQLAGLAAPATALGFNGVARMIAQLETSPRN